jgi:hypothetical protein
VNRLAATAMLAAALLASASLPAAAGPGLPQLSGDALNCVLASHANDKALVPRVAEMTRRLDVDYRQHRIEIVPGIVERPERIGGSYVVAFCAVVRNRHVFALANGISTMSGRPLCSDPRNFAVLFDPAARTWGKLTFGVAMCPRRKG